MKTESAIYECTVMHQRFRPKRHGFSYRVFYLWLDLDEMDQDDKRLKWLSRNRRNLFAFYDEDHLGHAKNAKGAVLNHLQEQGEDVSQVAAVRLLTFPRVLGYIFNPVCFYYTFDSAGKPLHAVAEVTNTFHEQKPYVMSEAEGNRGFHLTTPKHFYVSPFSALDMSFDFRLKVPGEELEILIDDRDAEGRVLMSSLAGRRRKLTDGALLACAVKYPLLTLRVMFLIHWHALLLWLKKVPWHRKTDHPELQREVLRPHHSITSTSKT